jgi:hypothetical protein
MNTYIEYIIGMNEGVVVVVDVLVLGVQVLACQVPATKVKSKN